MHGGVKRFLKTRHMQDIFDYFIKYVGSSAYHSPAFMNCLPTIQFRYDLWYVDGGLYNIALGLQRLMDELGITVRLNSEVTEVRKRRQPRHRPRREGRHVPPRRHHRLEHGSHPGLREAAARGRGVPARRSTRNSSPPAPASCSNSASTASIRSSRTTTSSSPATRSEHFHTVFRKRQLPPDPTIYLVAASQDRPDRRAARLRLPEDPAAHPAH